MGYKAYLQRGTAKLDLDTSPYDIAFGFVPPAVTETPNIGTGTSANQYGGGKLISKRTEPGAYSFSVRIMGNSNAHNEALVDRLDRFIRSGTEAEPVYFCWRPADNVDAEPLYGQWNATRRAKVITGSVYKSAAYYGVYSVRDTVIFADVNMIINPPEGKRQRVATATGGVIEDTIGTADGVSRGVIVAEATVNLYTNPIFGHSTPLNDWTVGADTIGEVVTDGDFVLFGSNAVRLTRKSGSTVSFYQSYTAAGTATHCLSFYAKKPDGSAVTAADIRPRYGATTPSDSTYTPVGNGWYRVYDTFSGIASATITGCTPIVTGVSIYVDGFQFEEKAYPTPLAHGDMLGHSWGGTAHDSATTRTAGSLKIPAGDSLQPSNFTWWIAFRMNNANTEWAAGSRTLLFEETTNATAFISTANGELVFSDGTNSAVGATASWAAGDIVIAHFTMDSAGMKVFKNGAQSGSTQATFVPLASPTFLYVGSSDSTTQHPDCTILGAGTYPKALTAAEIALDYANMLQAARGMDSYGGRVDWVPYLWTKDGDNVVDNCDDSTRDNWAVVASVPGSVAAVTRFEATISNGFDDNYQVNLSCPILEYSKYLSPTRWLYSENSGTAAVGTTSGDAYNPVDIDAVGANLFSYASTYDLLKFREYYVLIRIWDEGDDLTVRHDLIMGSSLTSASDFVAQATAAEWRIITVAKIGAWTASTLFTDEATWNPTVAVKGKRSTATNDVVRVDFAQVMPRPFTTIYSTDTSGRFMYQDGVALVVTYVSDDVQYPEKLAKVSGDTIFFTPGVYNLLISLMGCDTKSTLVDTTLTYNRAYITPRWALA